MPDHLQQIKLLIQFIYKEFHVHSNMTVYSSFIKVSKLKLKALAQVIGLLVTSIVSLSKNGHRLPWLSTLRSQIGMTGCRSCGTVGKESLWRWRHCLKKECVRSWLADGRRVGSLWRHRSAIWWKGSENLRCHIMLVATLSPTPESAWCTASQQGNTVWCP
jgi:hypothetical protein